MNEHLPRNCHYCGTECLPRQGCPKCLAEWHLRPEPHTMTPDEREAEMRSHRGVLEVDFSMLHKRFEELVGRPVWTHELGLNWEGLCKEARWEDRPATMEEIVDLISAEKRFVIELRDGE